MVAAQSIVCNALSSCFLSCSAPYCSVSCLSDPELHSSLGRRRPSAPALRPASFQFLFYLPNKDIQLFFRRQILIHNAIAKGVLPTLCNSADRMPLGDKLIAEGKTGVKAGEGVLKYGPMAEYVEKRNRRIIQMTKVMEQWDEEDR